ncbi:hypothetical protein LTR37_006397 [Vermiconidia calcicola]|uniref:Uncharacterized protein n=1 Tax=Vermiconidia calcicola TaxID=1690605 RepID=A0ACC3NI25_9PEZI|nr:hypothetical protein LTR37_006397 [Vermiconidia calcicola]
MSYTTKTTSLTKPSTLPPLLAVPSTIDSSPSSTAVTTGSQANDPTQNIIFGVLAVTLAFAALVVGWLQLRSYRRRHGEASEDVEYYTVDTVKIRSITRLEARRTPINAAQPFGRQDPRPTQSSAPRTPSTWC